jgi:SP family sugar:H+ symporter-like MFS transporter
MTVSSTSTRYVSLVAAGAAVGGFLFGFDTSTMNGAINGIRAALRLGPGAEGFIVAIVLIGCALGAWFAGPLSTRVGRLRIMFLAGILIALGSLTAALSSELALMGLSRLVVGLGIGAASAVIPPFIAEIAPTSIRGRLGSFWQFAIVVGQFLGLLVGYALSRWAGSPAAPLPWGGAAWRWLFIVAALPAAAYVAITRRLPESPHTLIRHGREDEAKAWLARVSDEPVEDQVSAIRRALAGQRKASLSDLRGPRFRLRPIVWTGILLAAFQQLVGINIVKTYSTTLWRSVGFSTGSSFRFSLLTVLISIASTVVAIAVMDRVGRRTLLVAGAAVIVVASGTLAVCFATATANGDDVSLSRAAGVAALLAVNVFAVGFGVTWGPVMWVMLSELFGSDIRSTAVAVCTAVNWLTNWAVTRTFPLLADVGLGFAYGVYTAFAVLALLVALKVLPETRGRSLA